jgi:hypothetical protein
MAVAPPEPRVGGGRQEEPRGRAGQEGQRRSRAELDGAGGGRPTQEEEDRREVEEGSRVPSIV